MKWFYVVLSYLFKQFSGDKFEDSHHAIDEIKEMIKANTVKLFMAIILATAIGSFFVVGVTLTMLNLVYQYDVAEIGYGILFFSLLAFAIVSYYATKHETYNKRSKKHERPEILNSLNEAVLLLVNEYITGREFDREIRKNNAEVLRELKQTEDSNPQFRSSDTQIH